MSRRGGGKEDFLKANYKFHSKMQLVIFFTNSPPDIFSSVGGNFSTFFTTKKHLLLTKLGAIFLCGILRAEIFLRRLKQFLI